MLRLLIGLLKVVAVFAVVAVVAVLLMLDPAPSLPDMAAPSPEDIAETRAFVTEVRAVAEDGRVAPIRVTEARAAAVLRVGTRFFPGARGAVAIEGGRVLMAAAVPVPVPGLGTRWLNATAVAPPFEDRPRLDRVTLGGVPLPPDLVVELARVGANVVTGNGAGDIFLDSARRLEVTDDGLLIALALDDADKSGFMRGLFGTMRGADMPGTELIDGYYTALRTAIDDGTLPVEGSYLPHLRFVLERVHAESTDATLANEYTAGIFALSKACGARDFMLVVGRLAADPLDAFGDWNRDCLDVTFNGRIDSRRHFTTAAAIQAASNRGVSVSIGEFKELHDSIGWERGGFDFTDIGANQSGIRLSNLVMGGTRADLRRTLDLMQEEGDVLIGFSDVPPIMLRGEFEERFGTIDSPEYRAMIAGIEAKIDRLTIHRPRQ